MHSFHSSDYFLKAGKEWSLDEQQWDDSISMHVGVNGTFTRIPNPGGPTTGRSLHSAVGFLVNQTFQMWIFGGEYTASGATYYLNDLWLTTTQTGITWNWTQMNNSGSAPAPRAGHSAVLLSQNEKIVSVSKNPNFNLTPN